MAQAIPQVAQSHLTGIGPQDPPRGSRRKTVSETHCRDWDGRKTSPPLRPSLESQAARPTFSVRMEAFKWEFPQGYPQGDRKVAPRRSQG